MRFGRVRFSLELSEEAKELLGTHIKNVATNDKEVYDRMLGLINRAFSEGRVSIEADFDANFVRVLEI